MTTDAVRVLIVDDDDLMRAGLRAVLAHDDSIQVVGDASDGNGGVAAARETAPDVVLMDIRMPGMDGIAATRELLATTHGSRVLVLTTFEHDAYVLGALRAGASGFLLKRTRPEQLIAAIHTIAAGEALLSPSVTRRVIDQVARQPLVADPHAASGLSTLTRREREVLTLIAQGLSNPEIAAAIFVEESTVKSHVKSILAKLGLRDRVHAVILAYETGLLRPGAAC